MKFAKALKLILSIKCQDAARLLSGQCDRTLSRSEKIALKLHLLICRSCKRYQKQLHYFQSLFKHLRHRLFTDKALPKASKDLRDRIVKALRRSREK